MAMNIYGRPMFQGGSIRMAPRRFKTGKEVRKFEFDKPTTPLTRDIEDYIEGTGLNKHLRERLPILGKQLQILKNQKQAGYDIREDLASLSDLDLAEEYFAGTLQYLMTPPLTQEIGDALIDQFTPTDRSFDPEAARQAKRILNREQRPIPIPKPERVPTPISKPITQDSPTPTFPSDGYNEYLEFIQGLRQEESYSPDRFSYLPLDESGRLIPQSFNKGGPIRRQEGGGIEAVMPADLGPLVEPPPMPAPPPPVEQALSEVERASSNVAEQEVGNYTANMMSGLDAAEESGDPEEAINALRGNEMPISERYEELATYVGDDDAERTPESVLLMVQPTIMLTEQGAMDSGIGSLMEGLVGDVDMQTEQGAPTPMGEGVGSLMMAQGPTDMEVGQEPPVNFNYGGPVQRFNAGGPPQKYQDLVDVYKLALYDPKAESAREKLIADQKDAIKVNTLLSLAQAGAGLAAGASTPQGRQMSTAQQIMGQFANIVPALQKSATDYMLIDSAEAAKKAAEEKQIRLKAAEKYATSITTPPKTPKTRWAEFRGPDGKTVTRLATDEEIIRDGGRPVTKERQGTENERSAIILDSVLNQLIEGKEQPSAKDLSTAGSYLRNLVKTDDREEIDGNETKKWTEKDYGAFWSTISPYLDIQIKAGDHKGKTIGEVWSRGKIKLGPRFQTQQYTTPKLSTLPNELKKTVNLLEDSKKTLLKHKDVKEGSEQYNKAYSLSDLDRIKDGYGKNLQESMEAAKKAMLSANQQSQERQLTGIPVLGPNKTILTTRGRTSRKRFAGDAARALQSGLSSIDDLFYAYDKFFLDENGKHRVDDKGNTTFRGHFKFKNPDTYLPALAGALQTGSNVGWFDSFVTREIDEDMLAGYQALRRNIEALLRIRTGAAAPETEIVRYSSMYLPSPTDTYESARQKMKALSRFWTETFNVYGDAEATLSVVDREKFRDLENNLRIAYSSKDAAKIKLAQEQYDIASGRTPRKVKKEVEAAQKNFIMKP